MTALTSRQCGLLLILVLYHTVCGLSLMLVLALLEGSSPCSLVFLPPQKPTLDKFQVHLWINDLHENRLRLM